MVSGQSRSHSGRPEPRGLLNRGISDRAGDLERSRLELVRVPAEPLSGHGRLPGGPIAEGHGHSAPSARGRRRGTSSSSPWRTRSTGRTRCPARPRLVNGLAFSLRAPAAARARSDDCEHRGWDTHATHSPAQRDPTASPIGCIRVTQPVVLRNARRRPGARARRAGDADLLARSPPHGCAPCAVERKSSGGDLVGAEPPGDRPRDVELAIGQAVGLDDERRDIGGLGGLMMSTPGRCPRGPRRA